MQLDKSKKYKFLGEVYAAIDDGACWDSATSPHLWLYDEFQYFANNNAVEEVREPLVFEGRVRYDKMGNCVEAPVFLPNEAARRCKTFKVTWTEVLDE